LVVDASVAIKWLVLEDMSDVAKELSSAGDHLVAASHVTLLSDWRPE
jgi:predicted nucleic acid-binding protein